MILIPVLGVLFILVPIILITRPYEYNYNIDEEEGMNNIVSKIKELSEENLLYEIEIKTRPEQKDMDFLNLSVIDIPNGMKSEIMYNRSGAFFPSVKRKESDTSITKGIDISILSNCLGYIEDCKKLIPEDYQYRHTEYILINPLGIYIRFAVAQEDKNNIKKNESVYTKTYKKQSLSGAGRRARQITAVYKYYMIDFKIDKNGKISIE